MVVPFPDFIYSNFWNGLAYDFMMTYDYKLRFYPKFMNVISYGLKSFPNSWYFVIS